MVLGGWGSGLGQKGGCTGYGLMTLKMGWSLPESCALAVVGVEHSAGPSTWILELLLTPYSSCPWLPAKCLYERTEEAMVLNFSIVGVQ